MLRFMKSISRQVVRFAVAIVLFQANPRVMCQEETGPARARESDSAPVTPTRSDQVEKSVVRIFSTARYPDLYKPWTRQAPSESTGSGVVIEGKRILTCAHVVSYASQIQVRANDSSDRISATVEALSYAMDLAVLKLEDPSFFDAHPPLPRLDKLPETEDTVTTYGYPVGGNTLSTTRGIISRVEFVTYNAPAAGLRIQVDAAINPGNSGGPAVVGGKMVGLAFRLLNGAQNIGYIIPTEEVELFLADIADGHYDGKPLMMDTCQGLDNPALRAYLKLDKSVEGVLVTRPDSSRADYPLKEDDIITRIGDTPVDNEGMIRLGPKLRVFFKYMTQRIAKDGKVPLTIWRNGRSIQVQLPVKSSRATVIPDLAGTYPPYFVCGPLVFSTATMQFVSGFGAGALGGTRLALLTGTGSPLVKRLGDEPGFSGESLVVLAAAFPHKLTRGYGNPAFQVIKSVNGIRIKSLEHLVEVLRDCTDQFLVIEFEGRVAEKLVFPRKEMYAATDDILTDNSIRAQGSPGVMAVWNRRGP